MANGEIASEAQINRLYAVLKSVGIDYRDFEREHNIKLYGPGNKPARAQCSQWIDELEIAEVEKQVKKDQDLKTGVQRQILPRDPMKGPGDVSHDQEGFVLEDQAHVEAEVARMALVMRFCVREMNAIVEQEINGGGLSEASRASILQRLATTAFIEAMRRGLF